GGGPHHLSFVGHVASNGSSFPGIEAIGDTRCQHQKLRAMRMAATGAGVPCSLLKAAYGATHARRPTSKRRPPEPSAPASTLSYPIASRNRVTANFAAR